MTNIDDILSNSLIFLKYKKVQFSLKSSSTSNYILNYNLKILCYMTNYNNEFNFWFCFQFLGTVFNNG